ncbi:MAG: hypothetical protein RSE12_08610 [Fuscovulum sp.]|nr:MAG: hypothetical protein RSE12_08610 [Fuscovulum sp.]
MTVFDPSSANRALKDPLFPTPTFVAFTALVAALANAAEIAEMQSDPASFDPAYASLDADEAEIAAVITRATTAAIQATPVLAVDERLSCAAVFIRSFFGIEDNSDRRHFLEQMRDCELWEPGRGSRNDQIVAQMIGLAFQRLDRLDRALFGPDPEDIPAL